MFKWRLCRKCALDDPLLCHLQVTLSKFFNPCYTTAQLKPTLFSKVTNTQPDLNWAPSFDSDWFV